MALHEVDTRAKLIDLFADGQSDPRGTIQSGKLDPNRSESENLPHPTELIVIRLERNHEAHPILESLHTMLSNGEASETS